MEEAQREAAMFGVPEAAPAEPPPPAEAAPEGDREAAMFGEAEPVADTQPLAAPVPPPSMAPLTPLPPDPLTLGGRLWLRLDFLVFQDTDAADQPVRMPNLLDVYLDATPVEGVRAFVSGRLAWDPTIGDTTDSTDTASALTGSSNGAQLDELWLRTDIERTVFFTLGAQHIRWGTGRIWNPTDVLNQARRDPFAPTDLRTGAPLLRAELPIPAIGGALQVVGRMDGADTLGHVGGAARLQAVLGPAELSVMAAARAEDPVVLGGDLSAGLGPLDLHAEVAVSHGSAHRWTGAFAPAAGTLPTREDRDDAWIPQVVGGLEWPIGYGDDDVLVLGAEYLFNDSGYSDNTLYPWLLVQDDYTPFYLGRHYAAVYALLSGPGTWDDTSFVLTGLANLSDGTAAARLNITQVVARRLYVEPYVAVELGTRGGEFRFAADVELPGGERIRTPPPLAQAGLWLRTPF